MTHPSLALQKAVFAALVADAAVGALIGDRIYDAPPRDAVFPYVELRRRRASPTGAPAPRRAPSTSCRSTSGRASAASASATTIMDAIEAALHDAALDLDGHALVNLRFEFAEARRDPDGIT